MINAESVCENFDELTEIDDEKETTKIITDCWDSIKDKINVETPDDLFNVMMIQRYFMDKEYLVI